MEEHFAQPFALESPEARPLRPTEAKEEMYVPYVQAQAGAEASPILDLGAGPMHLTPTIWKLPVKHVKEWTIEGLQAMLREMVHFLNTSPQSLNTGLRHVIQEGWSTIVWRKDYSLLHLAAEAGRVDVISILVDVQADLLKTDWRGRTPMDVALANGHTDCANMCQYIANLEPRSRSRLYHCAVATMLGLLNIHEDCIEVLWRIFISRDDAGTLATSALHAAAVTDDHHIVPLLFVMKADPLAKDSAGKTSTDLAMECNSWNCLWRITKFLEEGAARGREAGPGPACSVLDGTSTAASSSSTLVPERPARTAPTPVHQALNAWHTLRSADLDTCGSWTVVRKSL